MTGQDIANAAMTWLGTPHIDNAKAKGHGVDCAHLLIAACEEAGIYEVGEVDPGYYPHDWHMHRSEERFLETVKKHCRRVKIPQVGDIFLYRYGRTISHGAIYVGKGMLIHAYVGQGVILSKMGDVIFCDQKGRSRLQGIYRLKKLLKKSPNKGS